MKALSLLSIMAVLICYCSAISSPNNIMSRKVLGTNEVDSSKWTDNGAASPTQKIEFGLFLKQRNLEQFNQLYESLVDPQSSNYRMLPLGPFSLSHTHSLTYSLVSLQASGFQSSRSMIWSPPPPLTRRR